MNIVVNVSDLRTSGDSSDTLVTYSLGSCVGVCIYDPVARVAGLLHYQLPSASLDAQRAAEKPAMFADTGMALLLNEMAALGAQPRRLRVKLAGGASMLNDASSFNIGKRNQAAIRKLLFQNRLFIDAEDLGGNAPRTVYLNVSDGQVTLKSGATSKTL